MSAPCPVCNQSNTISRLACGACGTPLCAPRAAIDALPAGSGLLGGAFTVGKVLGQGGFGITYLGSERRRRQAVAIKELFPYGCVRRAPLVHPSGAMSPADFQGAKRRFLEEAQLLSRFRH